jgi:carboxyl-terminal processing protease
MILLATTGGWGGPAGGGGIMSLARWLVGPLSGVLLFLMWPPGLGPACQGQTAAPAKAPTGLTPEQRRRNLQSFEQVWKTVRDRYWDPKLGGLNWQAVHDELRPRLEKATTPAEAREVLRDMLRRLGQSHFAIIPAEVYRQLKNPSAKASAIGTDKAAADDEGVAGFDVRVEGGQPLVVWVEEGTPAIQLGVRPGWQILRVNGQDLAPALAKVRQAYQKSSSLDCYLARAVSGRFHGKPGEKIPVVFRNGRDEEVSLAVPLARPEGVRVQFGNLPPFHVKVVTRRFPPRIGYFSLSAFFDPTRVMNWFEDTIRENLHGEGFVLDLRGNPGGIGLMAVGMGNWFVRQPDQKLGTMTTRDGTLNFVLNPRPETFDGPLAILVDGCSVSTSEILAGGLQDLKRARIFGMRTAGAALPSQVERLPNGDGFQFAVADYVTATGRRLEGNGVRPDAEVRPTRPALLAGRDPVLEAALEWIRAAKPPAAKVGTN